MNDQNSCFQNTSRTCYNLLFLIFVIFVVGLLQSCGEKTLIRKESFHPNGSIWEQWYEDKAGLKSGKVLTYYDTGKLQTEGEFVNGYLHGEFVMWSKEGTEVCRGTYKNGEPWTGVFVSVDNTHQRMEFKKYEEGELVR